MAQRGADPGCPWFWPYSFCGSDEGSLRLRAGGHPHPPPPRPRCTHPGDFSAAAELKVRLRRKRYLPDVGARALQLRRRALRAHHESASSEHKLFVAAWLRSYRPPIRRSCMKIVVAHAATRIVARLRQRSSAARPARRGASPSREAPLRAQGGDRVRQPAAPPHVEVRVGSAGAGTPPPWRASRAACWTEHLNDYNGVADPEGVGAAAVVLGWNGTRPFVEEGGYGLLTHGQGGRAQGEGSAVDRTEGLRRLRLHVRHDLPRDAAARHDADLPCRDRRIERYGGPSAADRRCGRCHLVNLVEESRAAVAAIAAQIGRSGADWFRLDIFREVAPPRINEISYPSRSGEDPQAWVQLLCAYRQGRFRAVAGKKIWRQVAHRRLAVADGARLAPTNQCRARVEQQLASTTSAPRIARCFAPRNTLSRVSISIFAVILLASLPVVNVSQSHTSFLIICEREDITTRQRRGTYDELEGGTLSAG